MAHALRALALAGLLGAGAAAVQGEWLAARPDFAWSFPRDHWAHREYRTEWWYLTGHLVADGEPARRFGYQVTFFRVGLLPGPAGWGSAWSARDLVMAHAAVTDVARGRHVFSELLYRAAPLLGGFGEAPDPVLAWSRAPAGTPGEWTLRWNGEAFDVAVQDRARGIALRLETRPAKPLVLQGPNGLSRKAADDPAAASHYYSFTRLRTAGSLEIDGQPLAVRGLSWMDKEFGSNQLSARQVGWDWFSLQLDDGRDLMLYLLRDRAGGVDFAQGTLVSSTGAARLLVPREFTVRATRRWRSPATGADYPAGWIVEVPGERLRLEVLPEVADQENVSELVPRLHYWEGAVAVRAPGGPRLGQGYVELTGYGTATRPAL